jgi:SAM-dependent methyltransferase
MDVMEKTEPHKVDREHYQAGYDNPNRFASYWHQIDETSVLGGRILEVGIGNGTVAAVLRARGFEVTTVDLDSDLGPDVTADVRELPFGDRQFDSALAAEVLEHIAWSDVPKALSELRRVVRRGLVISVPNADVAFTLEARLPNAMQILRLAARRRIRIRNMLWAVSQRATWRRAGGIVEGFGEVARLNRKTFKCTEHHWELGANAIGAEDFVEIAQRVGLRLVREYRAPRFPIHHFFVFAVSADEGEQA